MFRQAFANFHNVLRYHYLWVFKGAIETWRDKNVCIVVFGRNLSDSVSLTVNKGIGRVVCTP